MLQSDDVMVSNMRVRNFRLILKAWEVFCFEVYLDSDETEEESEEDDDDID